MDELGPRARLDFAVSRDHGDLVVNLVDELEIRQASELLRRVIERMGLAGRLRLTP